MAQLNAQQGTSAGAGATGPHRRISVGQAGADRRCGGPMMNDGFEAGENSEPDRSLEAAVRQVFDDLSRDEFGEPVDVFAVTRDDELLDWLGAVDLDADPAPPPGQDPADAELVEMLLAWRRSVTTNASELAPPQPPKGADAPGRPHAGRLRRVPVVSAVLAVLMVCVGLGVAVQDAMPGDPLWGVSEALNSERAASIETAAQTRRYLDVAHTELVLGHRAAAAAALAAAQREIAQMRSDDEKRELQARQRELTNQLNRTTPASGQIAGSGATTPPSLQREDSATSVPADEQQARPSRSPFPQAAAPAGTPSTTSEPSMSDKPETTTPDSSAAGSDTPGPSGSATEVGESAAAVAGSHVEPSRDGERRPSDRAGKGGDAVAAVSSGSAQSPPPSGAPSSASADRAADIDSDSSDERHAEFSLPSSTTNAQPAKRPAQSESQPSSSADRDSSASSTPKRRAHPAPQSEPSVTSSSVVKAGEAVAKDKTARERRRVSPPTATPDPAHSRASGAADTSTHPVYDHSKAAAVTADSSGQTSSTTSRSADEKPSSPGSTARPANPDHSPTGTSATTARKHRDGQEQP
jgi:hypothetical protein